MSPRRPSSWRRARVLLFAMVIAAVPSLEADVTRAQRAIEKLEACSPDERAGGCVKILKRKSLGARKEAIKAQVRGGRIIWYEYDGASGTVRRTN